MKVLIIGGTGILSTAVVNECVAQGLEVTMINRGHRKLFINPAVELLKCDIHDREKLKKLLEGKHYDCVIDFLIYNVNQIELSLAMFGHIADQYVFISSTAVYNTDIEGILNENSEKVQTSWQYSKHKYECEQVLIDYCHKNNIIYTIIRPGVNFGNTRIPYGMYPPIGTHWTLIERILARKPIITWNQGLNKHNITRVEDFATGMVGLLANKQAYNQDFNVVGDSIYSWREVLDTIGKICNVQVSTIDIPVDFYASELEDKEQIDHLIGGRSKNCMTSNQKLKEIAPNFHQKYTLEEGLRMTLDFYKQHSYLDGIDYLYDGMMDRIIDHYQKQSGSREYDLSFVDYFGATGKTRIKNNLQYFRGRHNKNIPLKIFLKSIHFIKKA